MRTADHTAHTGKRGEIARDTYWPKHSGNTGAAAAKPITTESVKVEAARYIDKALAGAYRTTANLNLRAGAGTSKTILTTVPKGGIVRNYGYYNVVDGKKWLYVQHTAGGKTYTGYCSMAYLKK